MLLAATLNKKSATVKFLVLSFCLAAFLNIGFVCATTTGDAHGDTCINEDGTISPSDTPILVDGDVYTLATDLRGVHLSIKRSNIVFDGNGNTLYLNIALRKVENVTVKNCFVVTSGNSGVSFDYSSNITILNNTISGCGRVDNSMGPISAAVFLISGHSNLIMGNTIKDNEIGLIVTAETTQIYNNSFIDNHYDVHEWGALGFGSIKSKAVFDNGTIGNYWSNYDGTDSDGDKIGDTPYVIDENNQDMYPVVNLEETTAIPKPLLWAIFLITLITIVAVLAVYLRSFTGNQRKVTK